MSTISYVRPRPQSAGKSHKLVLQALAYAASREHNVYYVVKLGHSAGYYLSIACQALWASEEAYAVDHELRHVRLANGSVLAFKEFNPKIAKSLLKDVNPAQVFFDHATLPDT